MKFHSNGVEFTTTSPLPCSQRGVISNIPAMMETTKDNLYCQHLQQSSYCHHAIPRGRTLTQLIIIPLTYGPPILSGYALSIIHESTNINKQLVAHSQVCPVTCSHSSLTYYLHVISLPLHHHQHPTITI